MNYVQYQQQYIVQSAKANSPMKTVKENTSNAFKVLLLRHNILQERLMTIQNMRSTRAGRAEHDRRVQIAQDNVDRR